MLNAYFDIDEEFTVNFNRPNAGFWALKLYKGKVVKGKYKNFFSQDVKSLKIPGEEEFMAIQEVFVKCLEVSRSIV